MSVDFTTVFIVALLDASNTFPSPAPRRRGSVRRPCYQVLAPNLENKALYYSIFNPVTKNITNWYDVF
jgi:hypothetical protein